MTTWHVTPFDEFGNEASPKVVNLNQDEMSVNLSPGDNINSLLTKLFVAGRFKDPRVEEAEVWVQRDGDIITVYMIGETLDETIVLAELIKAGSEVPINVKTRPTTPGNNVFFD